LILLDTSVLIDALSYRGPTETSLREAIANGRRIRMSCLVLYEWLRGPRRADELEAQETLFPVAEAVPFGAEEAARAVQLFSQVPRARGRDIDIAIAATALEREAAIWTLNERDFEDIPGLTLYRES
jgi:predicted nucleic acid-binding protein